MESLWSLSKRPTLAEIELFSVSVTVVVYLCMLVIAKGIITRGTSAGVPLKNFLTGAIMSALAYVFTEPEAAHGPGYLQVKSGTLIQCLVCLVILMYSSDFNHDCRLAAAGLVVFSVLMNLKQHSLSVMIAWSTLHLVIVPGLDYINLRNAAKIHPPDTLTSTLMTFGTLSLLGWSLYIYLIGVTSLALVHAVGAVVSLMTFRTLLQAKVKTA